MLFDNLVTGDKPWISEHKAHNKILALKQAKRPKLTKRTLTTKVLCAIFIQEFWSNHASCCSKM